MFWNIIEVIQTGLGGTHLKSLQFGEKRRWISVSLMQVDIQHASQNIQGNQLGAITLFLMVFGKKQMRTHRPDFRIIYKVLQSLLRLQKEDRSELNWDELDFAYQQLALKACLTIAQLIFSCILNWSRTFLVSDDELDELGLIRSIKAFPKRNLMLRMAHSAHWRDLIHLNFVICEGKLSLHSSEVCDL